MRRDFTVNALYFDPATETIIDYHRGLSDLKQKTLRMIGDPATRYREDPVRMLRAVRLASKLDLTIEPATRQPIGELAGLIENVPPSRLFDEMLKLLTSGDAVKCLKRLRNEGLHHGVLPLLDVILDQPLGERFVMLALENRPRVRRANPSRPVSSSPPCSGTKSCPSGRRSKPMASARFRRSFGDGRRPRRAGGKNSRSRAASPATSGYLGLAAAFRPTFGQTPYAFIEQARFQGRLRLPAAARRIRRNRRRTRPLVDRLPERRRRNRCRCHTAAANPDEAKKRRRRKRKPAAAKASGEQENTRCTLAYVRSAPI